jgi:hypothetical protein
MGLRGFIVVKLHERMDHDELWELIMQYESMDGIEFASHVIGEYDFVLSIDTMESFESVIDRVRGTNPADRIVGLQISEEFDKHREIKDLNIFRELNRR